MNVTAETLKGFVAMAAQFALLTRTKTDDEILALATKYADLTVAEAAAELINAIQGGKSMGGEHDADTLLLAECFDAA